MRKDLTLVAALFAASLVATPLVMSGTKALATSGEATAVALPVATMPVEVAAVAPAPETCNRKVRVVYSGYGTPNAACITR
ncbi:hypothetical protein [Methylobacterium gregans]|uniref:Porin n=1 Tax=Methylobacterium gregans TaxID=374424 RepID=A0AA37HPT4_9HYPH|nr:hypothetical protein [Methylobacterium gregans]MDQ0521899.1 hypothetical protein [Methylobacterium gregans]GJD79436.1 hypothetical protein NBEOAGPD_2663 [Methylobacterium gregans]GLS52035.1 hypothetical protein GCM10007886_02170 [Methylobacterium gregans]